MTELSTLDDVHRIDGDDATPQRIRWQVVEARWYPDGLEIIVDGRPTTIPASEGLLPAFRFDRGPEPVVYVNTDEQQ